MKKFRPLKDPNELLIGAEAIIQELGIHRSTFFVIAKHLPVRKENGRVVGVRDAIRQAFNVILEQKQRGRPYGARRRRQRSRPPDREPDATVPGGDEGPAREESAEPHLSG